MTLHIITGPPAAGKTTYLETHAKPGDIQLDYHHLVNTLTGQPLHNHTHPAQLDTILTPIYTRLTQQLVANHHTLGTVWIIHPNPTTQKLTHYSTHGATIHTINPGRGIIEQRLTAQRRTRELADVHAWYTQHTTPAPKLNHNHRKRRQHLLNNHTDGTPCPWCGQPMYTNPERNFDHKPLAADHIIPRKHGGQHATRLLHFTCNSQRGDGHRDHLAPTNPTTPFHW